MVREGKSVGWATLLRTLTLVQGILSIQHLYLGCNAETSSYYFWGNKKSLKAWAVEVMECQGELYSSHGVVWWQLVCAEGVEVPNDGAGAGYPSLSSALHLAAAGFTVAPGDWMELLICLMFTPSSDGNFRLCVKFFGRVNPDVWRSHALPALWWPKMKVSKHSEGWVRLFPTRLCSSKCQVVQREGGPHFFPNLNTNKEKGKHNVEWWIWNFWFYLL